MTMTAGGLIVFFVVTSMAMHWFRPDLNPVEMAVSFYMVGSFGWLMGAGIIALGLGSLLLAGKLRQGSVLLAIWGIACVIAGIFPPDAPGHWDRPPSLSGMVHGLVALVAFVSFPLAALRASERGVLRVLAWLSLVSTGLFFGSLAPAFGEGPPFALGFTERIALAANVTWLLTAIRRSAAEQAQTFSHA